MGADEAALVDRVLALPGRERDQFLAELLARLPGASSDELVVSDDWLREIERRLRQVVSGEVVAEDWDVVGGPRRPYGPRRTKKPEPQ